VKIPFGILESPDFPKALARSLYFVLHILLEKTIETTDIEIVFRPISAQESQL
jgi:hypothetical protein